jgi:PAS domain S-box-containing protein
MSERARFPGAAYLLALLAVAAATLVNVALFPWTRSSLTPLFFVAVLAASWSGGLGPALLAAAAGLVVQDVIRSTGSVTLVERAIRAVIFLGTATFVSSIVTGRRRAEAQEHARRVWYEGMLTSVGDGVIAADADGHVTFLNAAAEFLTGWAASEAVGKHVVEVIPIEGVAGEHPATAALRAGGDVSLGRSAALVERSRRHRPIDGHAAPIRASEGRPAGTVLVFRDAAERRHAEEAASELAAVVASSHDAIICRGADDRITSWNPGAERLFGYTETEAVGRPIAMLLPPDRTDEMPRMLSKIEGGAAVSHYETERVDKDGRRLDISVSVSPLRDAEGRVVGMTKIARNITERRQAERRLAAQYAVGRVLAESATVGQAMPRLLEALGASLLWDAALFWRLDPGAGVLRCDADWHRGRPDLARAVEACRAREFAPGEGVPGRVWAAREPAWVEDVAADGPSARADAIGVCFRTGAAFPIVQGDKALGVVELLGLESRPFDEPLVGLSRVIGTQIGLFVDRKRAEDEFRKAEARFRRLSESGILSILVADIEEYRVFDANDTFLELIGATRDDLASGRLNWAAITPPEYREVDARAIAQIKDRGVCDPFVKEYVGLHGRRVSVLLGAASLEDDASRCIVFLIDVTERRRTEDALRHREEQLRLALAVARMGTWDWNLETGAVEWSEDLEEILGLERGGFRGSFEAFVDLVHPDDRAGLRAQLDRALDGADECDTEFRVPTPSGTTLWINARGRVFRDPSGRPVRMIGVGLDITARKRAEGDFREAKEAADAANLAKDEFLAVLSHELRTPLTPVLMSVAAMLDDPKVPDDYRAVLQMVRRNVELEARLIDDLLDVTRISRGKIRLDRRVVDAHELLYQALEICVTDLREQGLRLQLALDARSNHVEADPARLQQVFWNLIKNAVKFTPAGGLLTIRTRDGEGGRLVVEVVDTGFGIDAESLPRIFDAFNQGDAAISRRFGGLGLGLTISRSVIELLGGTLTASSEGRDHGSTFRIELPAAATASPDSNGRTDDGRGTSPRADRGTLRILIVEDNEDSLVVLAKLLRKRGHDVVTADSVASAVEVAATTREPLDLLISDLGLPDGTGFDVIRGVRVHSGCPAIALSGFGMEADLRRTREAGFVAHLVKPVDLTQLEEVIGRVVAATAGTPEANPR